MKNMRKLVPAFAMLMVAAIMMSTASFAWFSMNTTATATGMSVTAKSEGGLAIGIYTAESTPPTATSYASSASVADGWKNSTDALSPVSHNGSAWFTATAVGVNDGSAKADGSGNKYTDISGAPINNTTGAGYYYLTKWSIKTLAEGMQSDVSVTGVDVTIPDEDGIRVLGKSIRVAIYAQGDWYYFAPGYASAPSGVTLMRVSDVKNTTAATLTYGETPSVMILEDVSTTAQDVFVYIYFEGEDPNCVSSQAINLEAITVNLTFTAGAATAIPTP